MIVIGPRRLTIESTEAEITILVTDHRDADACRNLWRSVLEHTVDDMHFLRKYGGRSKLKKHQQTRLRRIHENPPAEFIEGPWFDQVCDYLDVSPTLVRRGILERDAA